MRQNINKKVKLVCLYQVVMHYRLPFYNKISQDPDIDFVLIHGNGNKKGKLVNANLDKALFKRIQLNDYRIPMPFSPLLMFHLIKESPDIVFTEGSSSLINSSIAFIYSKLFNKKFIWWSLGKLKNKQYTGFRKLINKWERYIELHSNAIFTYSTQGKEYFLSRGVDRSKIYVAVNVFDTNSKLLEVVKYNLKGYLNGKYFNIGFIGSIEKSKNLELLIDSVSILNSKYNNIKLHIIGDGVHLENLKQYSENNPAVIYYGRINEGASKILSNCDLFVLPGLGGLAICEAMLNSLPIITGNADGTEYDLVDEENGFIIENMDIDNLCEKIEFLYLNPDIVKKMKLKSFERITNDLSFEKYYSVFKTMIEKVK